MWKFIIEQKEGVTHSLGRAASLISRGAHARAAYRPVRAFSKQTARFNRNDEKSNYARAHVAEEVCGVYQLRDEREHFLSYIRQ